MASFHKPVAEVIPGMMSLALAGKAFKMIPSLDMMPSSKMISKDIGEPMKKKKSSKKQTGEFIKGSIKNSDKNFIKGSTEILIGIPLIGAVASSVAKL